MAIGFTKTATTAERDYDGESDSSVSAASSEN